MSVHDVYARKVVTLLEVCDDCYEKAANGLTLAQDIPRAMVVVPEQQEPHFGKQPCDVCTQSLAGNRWDAQLRFKERELWERVIDRFQPFAFRCECKGAEPSCARALNDAACNAQNNTVLSIAQWLRDLGAATPPF